MSGGLTGNSRAVSLEELIALNDEMAAIVRAGVLEAGLGSGDLSAALDGMSTTDRQRRPRLEQGRAGNRGSTEKSGDHRWARRHTGAVSAAARMAGLIRTAPAKS